MPTRLCADCPLAVSSMGVSKPVVTAWTLPPSIACTDASPLLVGTMVTLSPSSLK